MLLSQILRHPLINEHCAEQDVSHARRTCGDGDVGARQQAVHAQREARRGEGAVAGLDAVAQLSQSQQEGSSNMYC